MSRFTARLFVLLQQVMPKHLLTRFVYRLTRVRAAWFKNFLIRQFVNWYPVDVAEAALAVPHDFESFNAFFVRELADGARPIAPEARALVSPVDGTVSAAGRIEKDAVYQAKGSSYSLYELLATDLEEASTYVDGAFATIYLAPYNYHRVHAPVDGELVAVRYVPGNLFSVNESTVAALPSLFVRNERLICHLLTGSGPMVLIFVGAMNVGSISTRWTGEIRPRKTGVVEQIRVDANAGELQFEKGADLGCFNMGSTVILLTPGGVTDGFERLTSGQTVRMGESIGRLNAAS